MLKETIVKKINLAVSLVKISGKSVDNVCKQLGIDNKLTIAYITTKISLN